MSENLHRHIERHLAATGRLVCPGCRPAIVAKLERLRVGVALPPVGDLCRACARQPVKSSRRFRHCRHLGEVTREKAGCQGTSRYRCSLGMYEPDVCHLMECQRCSAYDAG